MVGVPRKGKRTQTLETNLSNKHLIEKIQVRKIE
jgi:hypothetical protein